MVRARAGGAGADADAGGSGGGDCGFDGDIPNTRQYKQLLRGRKQLHFAVQCVVVHESFCSRA